jgi:hypothetical protein
MWTDNQTWTDVDGRNGGDASRNCTRNTDGCLTLQNQLSHKHGRAEDTERDPEKTPEDL